MRSKTGPLLITAAVGLLMIAEWFLDVPGIKNAAAEVKTWAIIIEAFALGLGSVNILTMHARSIRQKNKAWYGSVFTIATMVLFAAVGIGIGTNSDLFNRMYDVVIGPAGTTMFSILCFSIISAGARCLRIKNVSSVVMICVIIIALISQVPFGEQYAPGVVAIFDWLMDVVNISGQRGIIIGAALGAFVHSMRILIGLERTSGTGS